MSRVSHWRVYLPTIIDKEGRNYVEVSSDAGDRLRQDIAVGQQPILSIVTGREINIRESRTLYVPREQIVALEPIEG